MLGSFDGFPGQLGNGPSFPQATAGDALGKRWVMQVEFLRGCCCSASLWSCWHCQPLAPCSASVLQVPLICGLSPAWGCLGT